MNAIKNRNQSVHPHVCGEHIWILKIGILIYGSSPRVWGTLVGELMDGRRDRFIPTCVGNMNDGVLKLDEIAVHPHVCGEHFSLVYIILFKDGSSPRVWGT